MYNRGQGVPNLKMWNFGDCAVNSEKEERKEVKDQGRKNKSMKMMEN
jgi:hypothetical protein